MMHENASVLDSVVFRDVFSTREMRAIWSDRSRTQRYLDFERALAATQGELGIIPQEAATEIGAHCDVDAYDFDRLRTETEHVGYPILPVVRQLTESCSDGLGQWCHWGATTQDVTDTATVLQIGEALDLLRRDLVHISASLRGLALTHRLTPMVGRSNLQQAVPLTFGFKVAAWLSGVERNLRRLDQLEERVLQAEFGGAVGTLAALTVRPGGGVDHERALAVLHGLCERLGLREPVIAWHTIRDTIAEVGGWLSLVTGGLAKIATDVKIMMATEIGEVQEPDNGGGRGASSTMPQKRNPISCAYITACASVVRQHSAALYSAMDADFERATGTWEIEWIVLPEIFSYTSGAVAQARLLLEGLQVHPDAMIDDLRLTNGLINTETVMMALAPQMGRERAHDLLSNIAARAASGEGDLLDLLTGEPDITAIVDRDGLRSLLDPTRYRGLSAQFVDRVLAGSLATNEQCVGTREASN